VEDAKKRNAFLGVYLDGEQEYCCHLNPTLLRSENIKTVTNFMCFKILKPRNLGFLFPSASSFRMDS